MQVEKADGVYDQERTIFIGQDKVNLADRTFGKSDAGSSSWYCGTLAAVITFCAFSTASRSLGRSFSTLVFCASVKSFPGFGGTSSPSAP